MTTIYKIIIVLISYCALPVHSIIITPKPPSIPAETYVLLNADTGKIIASFDETKQINPASITKLMTAYVVFESLNEGQVLLDDRVRVSKRASSIGGSTMFLNPMLNVNVEELLQGMIIVSGNDASIALAEHIAGTEEAFSEYMNEYAEVMGLKNTNYQNSYGLDDDEHYSSAIDIAILASRIIKDFPQYFPWYSEQSYFSDKIRDLKTDQPIKQFNRNKLLKRDKSVDGMKTGYTSSAGYCLVATAKKDNMRLIAVVTGSKTPNERTEAASALLNYGFRFFENKTIVDSSTIYAEAKVWKGKDDNISLVTNKNIQKTIPKGSSKNIKSNIEIFEPITAPIDTTQPIGKLTLTLDNNILVETSLFSNKPIEKDSIWGQIYDSAILLFE
jgi:D-alanyl-D-alanine carboxypeptidase (penicillin-binding protein 5/6)